MKERHRKKLFERRNRKEKKKLETYALNGVITVEMSYIFPIVFLLFCMIVYTVFYFHDKNIMIGAASETAVLGAQMERNPTGERSGDLGEFYQRRIRGKLILFPETKAKTAVTESIVAVSVETRHGWLALSVHREAPILKPEKKIRTKQLLENITGSEEMR